ncbi:zinc finger CCCH domain-containing protein 8-like [Arachis ipaensis]|nr:zinc finger CCCH domain-containing protein 8-like [Arachis ipaensis]XP_020966280.1 zinc finger CCCH domain-containing protein 8-like [Arachis ipaensis]XP_020966281.1 zinc finger CCCH domain-containing protein 8-like [Arachis ipaensis]XP_020966282.1 zinc finger CCCH domain-containing protein 8-like [Arachis ipaensis]XP_020966283.1 zinc finger CCCH domain-containing protein 8-like [Arachis ipaensis]XP_020966284.1 zinc finger CCCH domain-containing protein 8-like [Arachis ipaensis]
MSQGLHFGSNGTPSIFSPVRKSPSSAEKKAKKKGDKCHFSHDSVPFTKSKPCSFFVRHSCMKGDDCPFDHQLSKYPCVSFVSGGFCVRGECMLVFAPAKRRFCYTFKGSQPRNEISTLFRKHKFQHAT